MPMPIQLGVNFNTFMNTYVDSQNVDREGCAVIEEIVFDLWWVISKGEMSLKFYEHGNEVAKVKIGVLN